MLSLLLCSCVETETVEKPIYEEDRNPQFTTAPIVIEPAAADTLPEPPKELAPLQLDVSSRRAIERIDADAMQVPVSDDYVYKAFKRNAPVDDKLITLSPQREERLLTDDFRLYNRYTVLKERLPRIQLAVDGIVRQCKLQPGDPALFSCREYVRQYLRLQALRLELYELLYDTAKESK